MGEHTEEIPRTNVLGVGVSALDMEQTVDTLLEARRRGNRGYVCVTGVHGIIESQRDPGLKVIHNRSFLTVPDGMPTVWLGREQGFVHMSRVYGPDLMLALCAATSPPDAIEQETIHQADSTPNHLKPKTAGEVRSFTHFLYGSTPEVLELLKANLERQFPGIQIVGSYSPPFRPLSEDEESELQRIVADCRPDYFWVGLSTPKQERFMASHTPEGGQYPLDCGIMFGVGAAFDIHAGLLKDAPEWVKNAGLQWFYRLCQEPKRLWRRYADIVPKFLWLTCLQLLGIRKYIIEDDRR